MKRKLVTLVLVLAVACWITSAVAADYAIPLTADEVEIPAILETLPEELQVDQLTNTRWRVTFPSNPFESGADILAYLNYEYGAEDSVSSFKEFSSEELFPVEDGYAFEIEAPNISYFDFSLVKDYSSYTIKQQYILYDDEVRYYKTVRGQEYNWCEYVTLNDRLYSYGNYGDDCYYECKYNKDGTLDTYWIDLDDANRATFDRYGILHSLSYYDYDTEQWYYWYQDEKKWYFYDESYIPIYVDKPDGAMDPLSVIAPAAIPQYENYLILPDVNDVEVPDVPFDDSKMPAISNVEVTGNQCIVTLEDEFTINDSYTDENHQTFGDVGVFYELNGEEYEVWYRATATSLEGTEFSFDLPEGATFLHASVDTNVMLGEDYYYIRHDDNGGTYSLRTVNVTNDDGFTFDYYYENGAVYRVRITDPIREIYYTSDYDTETGKLDNYNYVLALPIPGDYVLNYQADGELNSAFFRTFNETGDIYYWNKEDGWYVVETNEAGEENKVPVTVPELIADPTSVIPPYAVVEKVKPAYNWYPNNTVGVLGLSLRDDLNLTDKWYNVVPIDLSVEGRQTVRLVASNMYYFGAAVIDVADGTVTVNYDLPDGEVYLKGECLKWFTSLDEITADFLANPQSELAFGEPVSIADDLGGAKTALLFICNHVTYRQPLNNHGDALIRYYKTNPEWVSYRTVLQTMLEQMKPAQVEAN